MKMRILFLTVLVCAATASLQSADAATITVTNTNDSGADSLRDALASASDGDTINFDPSLNGQTITLTSGELVIPKSVMISGPGANNLTVSGSFPNRVFHVGSGLPA